MVHFLTHKFSGLSAGRFSFFLVFADALDRFFLKHFQTSKESHEVPFTQAGWRIVTSS